MTASKEMRPQPYKRKEVGCVNTLNNCGGGLIEPYTPEGSPANTDFSTVTTMSDVSPTEI